MIRKPVLVLVVIATMAAIPLFPAAALNYGSGTYGTCTYDSCGITISTSGTVTLNVTPSGSGACTTQSDTVAVTTDDSNGYTLSMTNSSTSTGLLNGASTIAATTATQASPAALAANQWGYRVDGIGGFGAGPTTAQSNAAINAIKFAGVPASSGTPSTLATTAVAANPAINTTVWYSACASTSLKNGAYTSQITYTALTN